MKLVIRLGFLKGINRLRRAAKLGVHLALECLDFSEKKALLRYENTHKDAKQRSERLSGFAYQKLIEAIVARAAKVGVEIRLVAPSWTSIVG
jgi:IS605 OrfB family transposase